MGFAVMGFIGYFVKLIHIPMCVTPIPRLGIFASNLLSHRNNILVYVIYIYYSQSLIFCAAEGRSLSYVLRFVFIGIGNKHFYRGNNTCMYPSIKLY